MTQDGGKHRVNKVRSEISGQAVFKTPAAGTVLQQSPQIAFVRLQAEGKLANGQSAVNLQVVFDVCRHALTA